MNRRSFLSLVKVGLLAGGAVVVLGPAIPTAAAAPKIEIDIIFKNWQNQGVKQKRQHKEQSAKKKAGKKPKK